MTICAVDITTLTATLTSVLFLAALARIAGVKPASSLSSCNAM